MYNEQTQNERETGEQLLKAIALFANDGHDINGRVTSATVCVDRNGAVLATAQVTIQKYVPRFREDNE